MKRATIVFAAVAVVAMATAMPATAEALATDTDHNPPCVDIRPDPPGVMVDPGCVFDLLPGPADDRAGP